MSIEIPTRQQFDHLIAISQILQARNVAGISQSQLAKKLGISPQLLAARENVKVKITPEFFQQAMAAIEAIKQAK